MSPVASSPTMQNLESRIKNRLAEMGMTIQRLATESGISEPTIHAIFNRGDAKLSQLEKIAEALGVDLSFLVSEAVPPAAVNHSGDFNIVGTGISQKVKVSKAPAQELAQQLDTCQRDNEALRRELALANALVASKDETISLLRVRFDRPN